jgi:uncharacterized membrane protein
VTTVPGTPGRGGTPVAGDRTSVALLVSAAITALTLGTAFGLLALGVESFWVVFVLGFGVAMPTALGVVTRRRPDADRPDPSSTSDTPDPVETLQLRYVRGEITETEFEQRVATLLESDTE